MHHGRERPADLLGHPRGGRAPNDQARRGDGDDSKGGAHIARTTACSAWVKPECRVDSSLCAIFSALPMAPGTLKTTSSAASENRCRTGVAPVFSSSKPIARTKSWIGCMKRLVTNSFRHSLAR